MAPGGADGDAGEEVAFAAASAEGHGVAPRQGEDGVAEGAEGDAEEEGESAGEPEAGSPECASGGEEVGEVAAPDAAGGERACGGGLGVGDGRGGGVPAFPAGEPEAVAEVDVFAVAEVGGAEEAAGGLDGGAAEEEAGAFAGEDGVGALGVGAGGAAVALVPEDAEARGCRGG